MINQAREEHPEMSIERLCEALRADERQPIVVLRTAFRPTEGTQGCRTSGRHRADRIGVSRLRLPSGHRRVEARRMEL
jgi:hypothetical protein